MPLSGRGRGMEGEEVTVRLSCALAALRADARTLAAVSDAAAALGVPADGCAAALALWLLCARCRPEGVSAMAVVRFCVFLVGA